MFVYLFYNNVQVQEEMRIYNQDRLNFQIYIRPKITENNFDQKFLQKITFAGFASNINAL